MEISTEIKAKVISQYLGQTCQTMTRQAQGQGLPFKFLKGVLKEIDLGMIDGFIGLLLENETNVTNHTNYNTDQCKLILKPLIEITDEDAIEMAKLFGGIEGDVELNRPTDLTNEDIFFAVQVIQIEPEWASYCTPKKWRNINGYGTNAYQWLQTKGYDMPHYLLGGKTLHEAGLAIYETK